MDFCERAAADDDDLLDVRALRRLGAHRCERLLRPRVDAETVLDAEGDLLRAAERQVVKTPDAAVSGPPSVTSGAAGANAVVAATAATSNASAGRASKRLRRVGSDLLRYWTSRTLSDLLPRLRVVGPARRAGATPETSRPRWGRRPRRRLRGRRQAGAGVPDSPARGPVAPGRGSRRHARSRPPCRARRSRPG